MCRLCRPILILGAFAVLCMATSYSQRFKIIRPIYRPPPRPRHAIIRIAREANPEPFQLGLNRDGDVTQLPERPDDIKIDPTIRHARSLSTPGRGRASGSSSKSSRGHDTGATHPGYNRRNAREVRGEPTEGPIIYDDIKIDPTTRHARSLSTPGRGRASGYKNSRIHDTRATHPGYNRRNAREVIEEPTERPLIYDDIMDPATRHARSLSTPGHGRASGSSSSKSSRGHDTGATHPGYNRRNTRSLNYPTLLPPFNPRPKPWNPPRFPIPMPQRPRFPIYV